MTRSELMSRIRSVSRLEREAGPALRRALGMPLRHQPAGIPGRPDYANKRRRVAVFVDGEFWHGGPGYREPKTNAAFWRAKVRRNRARDAMAVLRLRSAGWAVARVWGRDLGKLAKPMRTNAKNLVRFC